MKLLFGIKAMNNPGGGAERVLATVANGLAERGHEVAILTFEQPGGQSFYPLNQSIRRLDLDIGSTVHPATMVETIKRLPALRQAVLEYAPEVAIGFMHSMFIPLGLALMGTAIPLIASEHIVPEHYRSRRWIETLLLSITPLLVRRTTCVSEQVRLSYPWYLRQRMIAIANPVVLSPASTSPPPCPRVGKTLLAVGRLEPQKDHATLINAFSQIATDCPEWHLRIIGDGSLRAMLADQIQALGLSEQITLVESTPNIASEYRAADLFVMPSRYESFGLTAVEALSYGLPTVGFQDCQGINQLVRSGVNGFLVDAAASRATALATQLKQIMIDEDLLKALSNGTTDSLENHHVDNVLDRWESLLHEICPIGYRNCLN
ncbi:glycosyltransferase family 4 protein [Halomicronema sp. CCY15110]|uniref:glycosyltransferase family 4 protein n=1 Tax=Halomicronema sp. CCY15110 TaxID=2767773 RepID=UPI001950326F|nr:glycosyltransferase family 4 protein [Halomicronema sp. CCY15110]